MIVTSTETGWDVVFQRSHGLLAGQLAARFRKEFRPLLWIETLEAILSHDDNKQPFNDRHYVTDLGAPRDFTLVSMASRDRLEEARRRITESDRKHRWCGLLMSRHVDFLYSGTEDVSEEMIELLRVEKVRRRRVLRQLRQKTQTLDDAYQLLRWCDRCSLILTRDDVPEMGRRIEVTHSLRNERYELWRRDDQSIAVEPWPFAEDEFQVEVEVRKATRLAFKDDADLIAHLADAAIERRSWRFAAE